MSTERQQMKWSQLKQRMEALFSESVQGRVELRLTRYRKAYEWENALYDYLRLPIAEILRSDNPLLRGLGVLGQRVGKARLQRLVPGELPEFGRRLLQFRCAAEGIGPHREPGGKENGGRDE